VTVLPVQTSVQIERHREDREGLSAEILRKTQKELILEEQRAQSHGRKYKAHNNTLLTLTPHQLYLFPFFPLNAHPTNELKNWPQIGSFLVRDEHNIQRIIRYIIFYIIYIIVTPSLYESYH
jgi:hypothetical protein